MTPEQQLTALVNDAFAGHSGEFRRCAIFEDRLDCIRILTRDCSITAIRVNAAVTVLEDTHYKSTPGASRYVGITIKGVRHFCKGQNISLDAPVRLASLLDAVLREFPETLVEFAIDGIARPLVEETAQVDLSTSGVVVMEPAAA